MSLFSAPLPLPAAAAAHQPPSITSFNFIKQISAGAFGTVHLALPPNATPSSKPYAIKAIKKSDLIRKNLSEKLSEERTALLKSRQNDFCVKLYYSLQTPSHVYFVMEYCVGGDLKSLINHMKFFPTQMASFYIAEVALALDYLHSKGIIHRDIKPDNMLIHRSGHVKLTDFGLSDVGLKSNMSPAAPGSSPFTPGQLASLAQPLSFSHCMSDNSSSSGSNSSLLPSPINISPNSLSSAGLAHTPGQRRRRNSNKSPSILIQPIQHSTPLGSLAAPNIPSILHTKHRKIRIPLRKLGSRSQLNSSSESASGSGSSSTSNSSLSLSSSWSIISGVEEAEDEKVAESREFTFKRVKFSPQPPPSQAQQSVASSSTSTKPFQFETSSFINVSFNFSAVELPPPEPKQIKPTNLPIPFPSLQQKKLVSPTTPSSSLSSSSSHHLIFSTPPQKRSPTETETEADKENLFSTSFQNSHSQQQLHPSPETGRLQHSHNHHHFYHPQNTYHSMPLIQKSPTTHGQSHHHHHPHLPPLKEDQQSQSSFHHANPKSPSWPRPDMMGNPEATSNKRKRLSEHIYEHPLPYPPPQKSSGLTLDFSAIHLPNHSHSQHHVLTPPPASSASSSSSIHQMYSTPVSNNNQNRLLGTPDYLSPELIRNALLPADSEGQVMVKITPASDWWSLGVCFYEFVIGVLPFNDDTPEQIFANVLDRALEYPDGLDPDLVALLDGLISSDVEGRFNLENLQRFVRVFPFDWERLRQVEPPWVPVVQGELDTGYFG